ncbi:MOSC domain-containing protein [Brevibacillus sp. SYSU BS000544]|uniref:MOSC domain-containing protein n=1 Tax=Brevibacillus sp. SYSU BS000544 TaxID=3416443 RepID=UPI003CE5C69B
MSKEIATIKEIIRHPVKSFRGESVASCSVEAYGLYGDRSHTFLDETRPGSYLTSTQIPAMLEYKAEFIGEEDYDTYPDVKITTPQGNVYSWNDQALLEEIQRLADRPVSQMRYTPDHVPVGAIDVEPLTITTESSIRKLEELWGKSIHPRRFRSNLLLTLDEDRPFAEEEWIGKHLVAGDVIIRITGAVDRCPIINIDPDTLESDKSLHKLVLDKRNNFFCVYGQVIRTGKISVGDRIELHDPETL